MPPEHQQDSPFAEVNFPEPELLPKQTVSERLANHQGLLVGAGLVGFSAFTWLVLPRVHPIWSVLFLITTAVAIFVGFRFHSRKIAASDDPKELLKRVKTTNIDKEWRNSAKSFALLPDKPIALVTDNPSRLNPNWLSDKMANRESHLPAVRVVNDLCDKCVAAARVVTRHLEPGGTFGELFWCGHHFNEYAPHLKGGAIVFDSRLLDRNLKG